MHGNTSGSSVIPVPLSFPYLVSALIGHGEVTRRIFNSRGQVWCALVANMAKGKFVGSMVGNWFLPRGVGGHVEYLNVLWVRDQVLKLTIELGCSPFLVLWIPITHAPRRNSPLKTVTTIQLLPSKQAVPEIGGKKQLETICVENPLTDRWSNVCWRYC